MGVPPILLRQLQADRSDRAGRPYDDGWPLTFFNTEAYTQVNNFSVLKAASGALIAPLAFV